jgi:hypothetical protein
MGHSVVLMPHVDVSEVPVPCAWGPHVPLGPGIALERHCAVRNMRVGSGPVTGDT